MKFADFKVGMQVSPKRKVHIRKQGEIIEKDFRQSPLSLRIKWANGEVLWMACSEIKVIVIPVYEQMTTPDLIPLSAPVIKQR